MNHPLDDAPATQAQSPDPTPSQAPAPEDAPAGAPAAPAAPGMSAAECAALLKQHFPALFGGKPRPLKLRIQADIQQRAPGVFPKQALGAFLRRYTASDAYLRAIGHETHRYDLDGQPAGEITAEHKEVARQALAQRRSREDARRAQERAGRQERAALLRDFESTTLTRENFCALKGLAVDQLDARLEVARRERDERRQFLEQLVKDFRASGKRLPDFAAERGLHPAQLDRLLREAGAPPGAGPGSRPGPRPGGREGAGERGRAGRPARGQPPAGAGPKRS